MTPIDGSSKLLSNLAPLVEGERLAPLEIERKLHKRSRLVGAQGLTGMARAGIDMATWDEEAVRRYLVG
jgi:mandelate racemase